MSSAQWLDSSINIDGSQKDALIRRANIKKIYFTSLVFSGKITKIEQHTLVKLLAASWSQCPTESSKQVKGFIGYFTFIVIRYPWMASIQKQVEIHNPLMKLIKECFTCKQSWISMILVIKSVIAYCVIISYNLLSTYQVLTKNTYNTLWIILTILFRDSSSAAMKQVLFYSTHFVIPLLEKSVGS